MADSKSHPVVANPILPDGPCRFCGCAGAANDQKHEADCKEVMRGMAVRPTDCHFCGAPGLAGHASHRLACKKRYDLAPDVVVVGVRLTDCEFCGGPGLAGNAAHRLKCKSLYNLPPD